MSWSVNLSGPREIVKRELADAILLFDKYLDWAQNTDADTVSINLGGYISLGVDGTITNSGVTFSFSETYSPKTDAGDE